MSPSIRRQGPARLGACLAAVAATGAALVAPASAAVAAARPGCTPTINAKAFASAAELRRLDAKLTSQGLRAPGSDAHNRVIAWLGRELDAIPSMNLRSDRYTINRWQPLTRTGGKLDLAKAGGLRVGSSTIPVSGAVPFTLPTSSGGKSGPLVYVPSDRDITAADVRGKIVVREVPPASLAYALFGFISHYLTPDVPTSGDYARPYFRQIDPTLIDAGKAGAVGVVFVWDVPGAQIKGYWEPHTGTRFRVPGVYVGNEQTAELKAFAREGRTARIVVRAKWDRARTRNLIATLPGQVGQRIVVNTHTDGNTWVQENGSAGVLSLARYLGALPKRCRHRTVQFALTSAHLGFTNDGTFRYARELDRDYDRGTVAFVEVMEHLGTREILPGGPKNRLAFTGKAEVLAWSVGEESPVMVKATIDAVKRRHLGRTAVLKGVEAPVPTRVPEFCSQGGLGSNFQAHLLPTMSTITGPWSLWAPSFGAKAIDFARMRSEVIAMGDVARALDRTSRTAIAGSYTRERRERAQGKATCDLSRPPAVAPAG